MRTPPCDGHWRTYDALVDDVGPLERMAAARAARAICDACPIRTACHEANAGEAWLAAMKRPRRAKAIGLRRRRPEGAALNTCQTCGCLCWTGEPCPACLAHRYQEATA